MRVLKILSRAVVVALALIVVTAAQARCENAVLYELTESMKFRGGDVKRQATAALGGTASVGTSICPAAFAAALGLKACSMNATATDNVDLSTGTGPATGQFAVVIDAENPDVDGPELVVLEGTLTGTIDLSPAFGLGSPTGQRIPLGTIVGTWRATGTPGGPLAGLAVGGAFHGTFRLPFPSPVDGTPSYLLDPLTGSTRAVAPNEYALGAAMVRLELDFN